MKSLLKEHLPKLRLWTILDPDVMFYRMSIFDDRAIGLFEKGIKGPVTVTEDEFETACVFNEMDLAVMGSRDDFFVPSDIAAVWEKVDTKEFHVWRKRASWVWKCLYFAERLYGYTPTENMLDLINIKKGFRMKEDEQMEVFKACPGVKATTVGYANGHWLLQGDKGGQNQCHQKTLGS